MSFLGFKVDNFAGKVVGCCYGSEEGDCFCVVFYFGCRCGY